MAQQRAGTDSATSSDLGYTQGYSKSVVASHASRTVQNSAEFLLPHILPNSTILDLGCGPGTITLGFCTYAPKGRVIGLDAGESVIAQARSTAPEVEYPNLTFKVADITTRLPFDDASIDIVYTSQTIYHIPLPVHVMKEAYRVLKKGGILAMRETDTLIWHPSSPTTEAYCAAIGKSVPPGAQGVGTGRRLHIWANEAGFELKKMQIGTGGTTYAAPELSKWWAGIHIERLQGEVGKKWLEEQKFVRNQSDIDAMIAGLKAWGEHDDAWYTALNGEVVCRK